MAEQQACLDHAELYLLELCVLLWWLSFHLLLQWYLDNGIGRYYFRGFVDMKLQLPRFWREHHLRESTQVGNKKSNPSIMHHQK
jgi:hypothetical protein